VIRSMTGFGDASARVGGVEYAVEIKSVNNKYFKAIMRLPDSIQALEAEFEVLLRRRLDRGSVTLSIAVSDTTEGAALEINREALDRYADQLLGTRAASAPGASLDLAGLVSLPGVLRAPADDGDRHARERDALTPLLEKACDQLVEMRTREGADLERDLMAQHASIAENLERVVEHAPSIVADYEKRLRARIEALLADAEVSVDQSELVREIAVYAEKTDIAEEITRLRGHLGQFESRIGGNDGSPLGRMLEFLTQEMLREANTMASKSPSAEIAQRIVEIKGAIDRIKEQVLNIA
jgi:uncharacterized protein (TIGR00255 family)